MSIETDEAVDQSVDEAVDEAVVEETEPQPGGPRRCEVRTEILLVIQGRRIKREHLCRRRARAVALVRCEVHRSEHIAICWFHRKLGKRGLLKAYCRHCENRLTILAWG